MAPGNRLGSEANVLGTTFLGTPDLSCGRFTPNPYINTASNIFTTYNVSGNCVKDIEKLDLEAALSYNNFFVQGEYLVANYNRNTAAAAAFAQAQLGTTASPPGGTAWSLNTPAQGLYLSPGNSRYVATGGYVQGEWWITGEEKSQSYDMKDKNGVTFGQLKIKDPFSKGGWGAWGLVGRWSVLNLDNGPFSGATRNALLLGAGNPWATQTPSGTGGVPHDKRDRQFRHLWRLPAELHGWRELVSGYGRRLPVQRDPCDEPEVAAERQSPCRLQSGRTRPCWRCAPRFTSSPLQFRLCPVGRRRKAKGARRESGAFSRIEIPRAARRSCAFRRDLTSCLRNLPRK